MIGIVGLLLSLSVLATSVLVYLREIAGRLSPRQLENYPVLSAAAASSGKCVRGGQFAGHVLRCSSIVYQFMPNAYVSVRDTIPGAVIGGAALGSFEVCFCLEPELFSLRSDLRIGRRGRCCADLELCFQSGACCLAPNSPVSFTASTSSIRSLPNVHVPSASYS